MNRSEFLANLLALSEAMLEHARQGDWDGVERLEAVRREALEACFAKAVTEAEATTARDYIERIMAADNALKALAMAARDEAGARLGELRAGRRAQAAYTAHR
jgi:hypothetical protein